MMYLTVVQMAGRRYHVWGESAQDAVSRALSYWNDACKPLYVIKVTYK
jgi:hypothetical protein